MKRLSTIFLMALMVLALTSTIAGAGVTKFPEMKGDWVGDWHVHGPYPDGLSRGGQMNMVMRSSSGQPFFRGEVSVMMGGVSEPFLYAAGVFSSKKDFKIVGTSCVDGEVSAFISGTVAGSAAKPTITGVWEGTDGRVGFFNLRKKDFFWELYTSYTQELANPIPD